ncbi:hypothetical protein B0O80DRAFT_122444 [Mortierella sp. GBAus27b]|nr:hypothetical protein B0O80DRAFT_122444 [Mortierella sp. GBAus27b]
MDRGIDLTVQIDADNPTQIRDLDWGISESMKMEHLKDDNKRFCEKCDSKEDAHVYHYLTSLPKIMILRLQRYNFKESAVKIQNGVSCTEKLNFEKWMANDYKGPHPTYGMWHMDPSVRDQSNHRRETNIIRHCYMLHQCVIRTLCCDRASRSSHYIGSLLCLHQEDG